MATMKQKILCKNLIYCLIVCFFISNVSLVNAGVVDVSKKYANKAMFWKKEHLDSIEFKTIYPKPFYKKSYFSHIVLATTVLAGFGFAYFSLGAGAPAAATGVSTVASWIGGGTAGSYMAGLSTVGGVVGGNAMTGAVILNGLSYGIIGGSMGKFCALSAASKFGVMVNISSTVIDGVAILQNPDTGELYYTIRFTIPKNLGGRDTRDIVDRKYQIEEEIAEAIKKGDSFNSERFRTMQDTNLFYAEKLLTEILSYSTPSQEDLLVLGLMCYEKGNVELFQKALTRTKDLYLFEWDNYGFIDYLEAVSALLDRDIELAKHKLGRAIYQNPYAIEPIVLLINLLSDDLEKNEKKILTLINFTEDNFNSNKYSSNYSLLAPYFRLGTIYYLNEDYDNSKKFYKKAENEIGFLNNFFGSKQLKNQIRLGIANCYYQSNDYKEANKIYNDIVEGLNPDEVESFQQQYVGSY
jgi:hypothetical protein